MNWTGKESATLKCHLSPSWTEKREIEQATDFLMEN